MKLPADATEKENLGLAELDRGLRREGEKLSKTGPSRRLYTQRAFAFLQTGNKSGV